jgi:hypothetical protein
MTFGISGAYVGVAPMDDGVDFHERIGDTSRTAETAGRKQ